MICPNITCFCPNIASWQGIGGYTAPCLVYAYLRAVINHACMLFFFLNGRNKAIWNTFLFSRGGGGGGHLTFMWTGGGGCRWGSKTWPCRNALGAQKIHPVTIYLTKKFAYAYPVAILHRRWCPDHGPVINNVGWEPLGSNPVINGVARQ